MPTQLIKRYIEDIARWLRNQQDYDDFGYGTEPIPGDKTWCNTCKKPYGKDKQPLLSNLEYSKITERSAQP